MGGKPGPSNSNNRLQSENKATWSKKATEIGSVAPSSDGIKYWKYPRTESAKVKIEFVCASRKPVVEFLSWKAH